MRKIKYWLPVLVWAGIIFWFSSKPVIAASVIDWQDFFIKKTAHFTEFFILYVLVYRAFKNSLSLSLNLSPGKIALTSLFIVIIYAISDEYHQSFVSGRTSTLRDVIIDMTGGIFAFIYIWKYLPKAPEKLRNWAKNWQLI